MREMPKWLELSRSPAGTANNESHAFETTSQQPSARFTASVCNEQSSSVTGPCVGHHGEVEDKPIQTNPSSTASIKGTPHTSEHLCAVQRRLRRARCAVVDITFRRQGRARRVGGPVRSRCHKGRKTAQCLLLVTEQNSGAVCQRKPLSRQSFLAVQDCRITGAILYPTPSNARAPSVAWVLAVFLATVMVFSI